MIRLATAGPAVSNPNCKLVAPMRVAYTLRNAIVLPASTPYQKISKYKLRMFERRFASKVAIEDVFIGL